MEANWAAISRSDPPGKHRFQLVRGHKPASHVPARERRRYPRFRAVDGAYAVLGPHPLCLDRMETMTLGQIAMAIFHSRPLRMGQIYDIGPGGMAFDCLDGPDLPDSELALDLVFATGGLLLSGLAYRIVSDDPVDSEAPFEEPAMRRLHLQFLSLPYRYRQDLNRFMDKVAREDRTWKKH